IAPSGGTVQLTVPIGKARIIQVLGVETPNGCPIGSSPAALDPEADIYEIGRVQTDVTADAQGSIQNTYDPDNPRSADCGGPDPDLQITFAHPILHRTYLVDDEQLGSDFTYTGATPKCSYDGGASWVACSNVTPTTGTIDWNQVSYNS